MALRALLIGRQLASLRAALTALLVKDEEFATREAELEAAINELPENASAEDREALDALVNEFTEQHDAHEAERSRLTGEIQTLEDELAQLERSRPAPAPSAAAAVNPPASIPTNTMNREDGATMPNIMQYRAFGSMTFEERNAFVQRDDVQDFLTRFRTAFSVPAAQQRAVTGADLQIPTVVLELIRSNILDYSKLIRRVHLVNVNGDAVQNVMGTVPEAVWTETCAKLNELNFTLNQVEVGSNKVGGYVAVCNALLEDAVGLLAAIIAGIGQAIGKALDKAILFGTGVKMPLGIATRLAQTAAPAGYSAKARPWVDLHTTNIQTIASANATGVKLFQGIANAAGAAKGRYSRGEKFWAMNEATYSKLQVEAMTMNAAGAIVSGINGTMPVLGGDIVVFGDDVVPNNTIIGGYGDLYLLAERSAPTVGYSDLPLYIEDQTVVKGTARYDGLPVIAEGFVVIGVGGAPTTSVTFAPDAANAAASAAASED